MYKFLCFSASQLRESKCYFYANPQDDDNPDLIQEQTLSKSVGKEEEEQQQQEDGKPKGKKKSTKAKKAAKGEEEPADSKSDTLVNGIVTADTIRSWMGNFEGITPTAKLAARLGQCLSRSIPTVVVSI